MWDPVRVAPICYAKAGSIPSCWYAPLYQQGLAPLSINLIWAKGKLQMPGRVVVFDGFWLHLRTMPCWLACIFLDQQQMRVHRKFEPLTVYRILAVPKGILSRFLTHLHRLWSSHSAVPAAIGRLARTMSAGPGAEVPCRCKICCST